MHGMRVARKLLLRPALRRSRLAAGRSPRRRVTATANLSRSRLRRRLSGRSPQRLISPLGYNGDNDDELAGNIARLLDLGVVGINFEDRVVKGSGLYDIGRQAERITTVRETAQEKGVELFINARTDLFLGQGRDEAQWVGEALDRAKAYAAAGASGFFIPGLGKDTLIGRICESVAMPVNVMVMDGVPSNDRLTELGVSRISYGPIPYINVMA